jgi:hypothetical protein
MNSSTPRQARIYQPSKSAMQSGKANTRNWILEYIPLPQSMTIDPLMGWSSSSDTQTQLRLSFKTQEEAVSYAKREGMEYQLIAPKKPRTIIKSYSSNFTKTLTNQA